MLSRIIISAVAVFTGCDCSEAALVPLVSLYFTLSLLIFHYLTQSFCVCELAHTFVYSTFLLVICTPPPPFLTPPHLPHFSASSSASPHVPFSPFFVAPVFSLCLSPRLFSSLLIFFSWSHSSFELHGRNRAWCQLDERGHGGPADLVMLSHHEASLSVSRPVSLSHAHTK